MKKSIYTLLITIIFLFTACSKNIPETQSKPNVEVDTNKVVSLNIITTNKLLYNMVKDIVQDRHCVSYMFSSKDRLWNFNFTDDSINNISKKDLFFYWGSSFEPWSSSFVDKLSKTKVGPIDISRGVKLIGYDSEVKYQNTVIKDNPYYWMNIDNYKIAMLNIKNAIEDKDTKDRDYYENNFSKNINDVEAYQEKLKDAADSLKDFTFVVEGDSLDYFVKYYGFKVLKVHNLTEGNISNNENDNKAIYDKIKGFNNSNNIVFLYDENSKLTSQAQLISEFKLKTVNIISYKDDIKYLEILDHNLKTLQGINPSVKK
ncbi:metal ABC transporter substrate-binding protein [Candidatus Clostridium stratigraminis]|uniref:Metal ABC transporter substrate-binding protein n=1 Tax=Candidatus Clostridium stratigraminis TaxID=3381661 RepID=A0ABW8T2R8_9CLOT